MADVFISYNHEERERISTLLSSLQSLGLSVWFDARIQTGETFDEVIEAELEKAKAILVCWSEKSARSKWVRSEAAIADNQRMLVPCFIEKCKLPPPFNLAQAADLTDWSGSVDHPGWSSVLERIGSLVKRPGLLPLAQASASGSSDKLAKWAKAYPDDPFAPTIWQNWQQRECDQFKQQYEESKDRVAEYLRKRQSNAQKRLTAIKRDFDQWVGKEGKDVDLTARPDLSSFVAAFTRGAEVESANDDTELQTALSALESKKTELETALAKAEARSNQLAQELSASHGKPDPSSKPKLLPLVFVAIAGIGVGIAGALTVPTSGNQPPNDPSLQSKLSDAQDQIQKLQQDNQTLKDQNADLQQKVDNTSPNAQPSPTQTNQEVDKSAATECTLYAGNPYDPDNTTGLGSTDIGNLPVSALQDAIQSCKQASETDGDNVAQRRMYAQLGRLYAALAVKTKEAGDDDSAAHDAMSNAIASLDKARTLGSAYAISLIGSLFNGEFDREADVTNFFVDKDPAKATELFQEAGIPLATTILAQSLLERNDASSQQQALTLLSQAEEQNYPRAFITHARALLSQPDKRQLEAARRSAGDLLAHAFCQDRTEFFRFYYLHPDASKPKSLPKCS